MGGGYFSCSSTIEEEEELDDKITKKKKRNVTENLRIHLLRARTMNKKNGSMIQVRRTYFKKDVKNNETINPIINIEDEERKEDEEVEKVSIQIASPCSEECAKIAAQIKEC